MFKVVSLGIVLAQADTRLELVAAVLAQMTFAELLAVEVAVERAQRELARGELLSSSREGGR